MPKKSFFCQNFSFFWAKNDKIVKNKKLNKKLKKKFPRHMYLDGFCKNLAILDKKYFFDPCSKIFGPKTQFLEFLKNASFNQKSDHLNRLLRNFLSKNVYFYVLYLISFQVTTKTIFTKREGGTILKSK